MSLACDKRHEGVKRVVLSVIMSGDLGVVGGEGGERRLRRGGGGEGEGEGGVVCLWNEDRRSCLSDIFLG